MAYSPEQWERTKAYFESGQYSLSQISDKTGISKSKISERAKKELWERGRNADYIEARKTLAVKKGTEKGTTLQVLDDIADEAIANKKLVFGLTTKALKKASELLEQSTNMYDVNTAVQLADRASLTLGINQRHAPKVEVKTGDDNSSKTIKYVGFVSMSEEKKKQILKENGRD